MASLRYVGRIEPDTERWDIDGVAWSTRMVGDIVDVGPLSGSPLGALAVVRVGGEDWAVGEVLRAALRLGLRPVAAVELTPAVLGS